MLNYGNANYFKIPISYVNVTERMLYQKASKYRASKILQSFKTHTTKGYAYECCLIPRLISYSWLAAWVVLVCLGFLSCRSQEPMSSDAIARNSLSAPHLPLGLALGLTATPNPSLIETVPLSHNMNLSQPLNIYVFLIPLPPKHLFSTSTFLSLQEAAFLVLNQQTYTILHSISTVASSQYESEIKYPSICSHLVVFKKICILSSKIHWVHFSISAFLTLRISEVHSFGIFPLIIARCQESTPQQFLCCPPLQ